MKLLNVFVNDKGEFGNPVGIILDDKNALDIKKRQQIANKSGLSEVVFIDNIDDGKISIYSPTREIPFAGHAVLGAAYLLENEYSLSFKKIMTSGGSVDIWGEGDLVWVRSELRITPPWWHEKLNSVEELESLRGSQSPNQGHVQLWVWIDEQEGIVRARTFAADWGIVEDEANGSGSMRLAAVLGRNLVIHHGKGSVIYTKPQGAGFAAVGGRVKIIGEKNIRT